ncbi:hypothetical protein ACFJIX_18025 [Roseateles sp. UC29_93]|uniref:hypothetical protein n=1 Tax=Roseateles sp. UC29_93 TaxID=3350177 RepID=UPI00366A7BE0
MPPVIIAAIALYAGAITLASFILVTVAYGISQYQASRARRKGRDAYNAALQDRLVMTATVDQPRTRCYGRVRNVDGIVFKATWGDKKQFYTLVIALCGHEIDGVETVMFVDTELTLDGLGQVVTEPWRVDVSNTFTQPVGIGVTSVALPDIPIAGSVWAMAETSDGDEQISVTVAGAVVTFPPGSEVNPRRVVYQVSEAKSRAVVTVYNGGSGQDLSAALATRFPDLIVPGAHRFAGMACLLVELAYDQDAFPNGVPNPITAVFRGARIFDPRTGVTAWSENNALIARDWSLYANGGGCDPSDLVAGDFIAAANACDVVHAFKSVNGDGEEVITNRPMYTCGIVCSTEANPLETLSAICESMAGDFAWPGGLLSIRAGAYSLPVGTITGDWLSDKASIDIVKDAARADLVNVITPSIANAANRYIIAPIPRVAADAYIAVDGEEYPEEMPFEGVTDSDHAAHVASVMLKDARAAKTYTLPCNLRGLQVKVGQNWTVNIPEIGLSNEPMRCIGWELDFEKSCCFLSMKATNAEIFDPDAEFKRDDALPNSSLPSPFIVPAVTGLVIQSGTSHLFVQSDGTVVSRVLVSWTQAADEAVQNGGAVDIRYGTLDKVPEDWQVATVPGIDTQVYLTGLEDGRIYGFTVRFRNKLVGGKWGLVKIHQVLGKSQPPAAVTGLAATRVLGALVLTRTPTTEADWADTIYEYSTNGGASYNLIQAVADRSGATWNNPVIGALRIRARDVDTSNNVGTASTVDFTVTPDNVGGPSSTLAIKINVNDFAGTTNYSEAYIHGRDAAGAPADINGTILLNGESVNVPKGSLVTGQGPVSAFIVWDRAGLGFSTTIPDFRPWAMARKVNGGWQYDNNSGWVAFTPTAAHYVIGLIQTGGPDTGAPGSPPGILSATMLSSAWVPDVIAALGTTADWVGVANRPKTFVVRSRGLWSVTTDAPSGFGSGIYDGDTGTQMPGASAARSYRAQVYDRAGVLQFNAAYDVYASSANANAMAADLTTIATSATYRNMVLVAFADDEPYTNHLTPALVAAMKANGASSAIFERRIHAHGAYTLIAVTGCGEGNGFENYGGEYADDPGGWCESTFQLSNGAFIVSGDRAGARSVYDYGYLGSNDATTNNVYYQSTLPTSPVNGAIWINSSTGKAFQYVGGVWQPYVGTGSVGTGELVNQAATEVYQDNIDLGGPSVADDGAFHDLRTFSVTPPVNATLKFAALVDCNINFDNGARMRWAYSAGGEGIT